MQLLEFLIFLTINLILGLIGIAKKGVLYGVIGLSTCIFIAPLLVSQGLILGYNPVYSNGTVISQEPIYASSSVMVVVMLMLIVIHFIGILKAVREI